MKVKAIIWTLVILGLIGGIIAASVLLTKKSKHDDEPTIPEE